MQGCKRDVQPRFANEKVSRKARALVVRGPAAPKDRGLFVMAAPQQRVLAVVANIANTISHAAMRHHRAQTQDASFPAPWRVELRTYFHIQALLDHSNHVFT